MYCHQCGNNLPNEAKFCSRCGANISSDSRQKSEQKIIELTREQTEFINGFSFGALFLNWLWLFASRLYSKWWVIILLFIPLINLSAIIWLGIHGKAMAWEEGRWSDFNKFRDRQITLDRVGLVIFCISLFIGIFAYFGS